MIAMAESLNRISDNLASIYAMKAGTDPDVWREAMAKESWYSADEAVAVGLADRVDAKKPAAKNSFDLTLFKFAGRNAAPDPGRVDDN